MNKWGKTSGKLVKYRGNKSYGKASDACNVAETHTQGVFID